MAPFRDDSPGGAKECSPRRQPWDHGPARIAAPEGRKKTTHGCDHVHFRVVSAWRTVSRSFGDEGAVLSPLRGWGLVMAVGVPRREPWDHGQAQIAAPEGRKKTMHVCDHVHFYVISAWRSVVSVNLAMRVRFFRPYGAGDRRWPSVPRIAPWAFFSRPYGDWYHR